MQIQIISSSPQNTTNLAVAEFKAGQQAIQHTVHAGEKITVVMDGVNLTGNQLVGTKKVKLVKVDKNLIIETEDGAEKLVELVDFYGQEDAVLTGDQWAWAEGSELQTLEDGVVYVAAAPAPAVGTLLAGAAGAGGIGAVGAGVAAAGVGLAAGVGGGGDAVATDPTAQAIALAKIEAYNNVNGTTPAAPTLDDYAAAGVTGVTTDNLAAVNAQVLKQVTGGADTVADVLALVTSANAALAKIEAYNNGNGTTPSALTLADYAEAGIAGVTADNLAAINAKILALSAGGADTAPDIQGVVDALNNALAKIEDYNNGNGTTPPALSLTDYSDAGITGVTADNLAAVNAQVLKQVPGGANAIAEVQPLVAAADEAITKIEDFNNGTSTTPPALTLADYAEAGIAGVTADNLAAINAKILALSAGGADTAPDIQGVVDALNNALAKIEDYNNGNGTTPPALSLTDYSDAGITGVMADILAAVNAQVLKQAAGGANTIAEIQPLVAAANEALNKIERYNNGNGTNPAPLTVADYADAGITGVTADNLAAVNAQVLKQAAGGANAIAEVQQLVADANNALTKIENYNNGNGTDPAPLTVADYVDAGITGVTDANLAAVNAKILAQAPGGADSALEIQGVVTALNTALVKIEDFNNGNGTNPVPLTVADYAAAGITGVTDDNLAAVNAQVLKQAAGGANSIAEVQQLVADANTALAKIENYNNGNGTDPAPLTVADYADAGITGVSSDNLAAVNAQVLKQAAGGANTITEIQPLVAAANDALAKIEEYNNGNGTEPAALTVADYVDAGITGVSADNLAAINAKILALATGGADSALEIQGVVTALNAALVKIEDFNNGNGTNPLPLTVADYAAAGITGVTDDNLAAVNVQVLKQAAGGTNSIAEVQQLVADANNALAKIENYNNGNGTNPAPLTEADYADAGITGVTADNLAVVNAQVLKQAAGGANATAEVQALVAAANEALAKIERYNNGNGTDPAPLTLTDYADAGVTGVTADNLASVNAKVLMQAMGDADSQPEIQALVTGVNTAVDALELFAQNNTTGLSNATGDVPTLVSFANVGLTGVTNTNLSAINDALASEAVDGSKADTAAEVQAIVNAFSAILNSADGMANGNGTPLTTVQYTSIGVDEAPTGSGLNLLDSVVDVKANAAVDTVSEVQALADAAKAVMTGAAGGAAPTLAQLNLLGVTGLTTENLATAQAAIAATADTGVGVDTLLKLQNVISGNVSSPAISTALGGVTNLDVTSNLVFSVDQTVKVGTGQIHITDVEANSGGTGYRSDVNVNTQTINVATAVDQGLLRIVGTGANTKIIVNPMWDLDLSSNYTISFDAGTFTNEAGTNASVAIGPISFSTVAPGTHTSGGTLAGDVQASQRMDDTGALQASKSWIDLESFNTNTTQGILQIGDLSLGSYALVMKNYATTPGGGYANPEDGGFMGIQTQDVSIGVINFGANDQLYFDSQLNDAALQKFAPEYISAIQNAGAGSFTGGIQGQNLLNFDLDRNTLHEGSSAQIALGFQGSTEIFDLIYAIPAYPELHDMTTTLNLVAPVVMG